MKMTSFSKRGTGKSVVVVEGSAKKEEAPADYSPIRELNDGIERRDADKWYEGYLRVKYLCSTSLSTASGAEKQFLVFVGL